jgi:hypothetical protein
VCQDIFAWVKEGFSNGAIHAAAIGGAVPAEPDYVLRRIAGRAGPAYAGVSGNRSGAERRGCCCCVSNSYSYFYPDIDAHCYRDTQSITYRDFNAQPNGYIHT